VQRSVSTTLRIFITYRPLRFFTLLAALALVPGFLLGFRFVYHFLHSPGNIRSLILIAMLIMIGCMMRVIGEIADLVSVNRKLLERTVYLLELQGPSAREIPSPADMPD
jgi:hypothetical protein